MVTYNIKLLGPSASPEFGADIAYGLNSMAIAVGASADGSMEHWRAVQWNPGIQLLTPASSKNSVAYGINDYREVGEIVGGWGQDPIHFPGQAFLYKDGSMHDLAGVFNAPASQAHDINNSGVIAAWAGSNGNFRAFSYDSRGGGQLRDLGVLQEHKQSFAFALNDKKQIVGISIGTVFPHAHAFLYDRSMADLGPANSANDINENGQVVGARVVGGAAHWTAYLCETSSGAPKFMDLGPLPLPGFVSSEAHAINEQGDIVGHSEAEYPLWQARAWVRPAGGMMQDLNSLIPPSSGWLLNRATAINDKGQIAGLGTHLGMYRAYLLTPTQTQSERERRLWVAMTQIGPLFK